MGMLIISVVLTTTASAVAGTDSNEVAMDGLRKQLSQLTTMMMTMNARMSTLERENFDLKNNLTRLQNADIFDCYRESEFSTGTGLITFDGCSVDTTEAGNNPSSGIFTVTQSGIYRFTFQAYVNQQLGSGGVYLQVDGTPVASSNWDSPAGVDADYEFNMLPLNTIQDLVAGQVVTIVANMNGASYFGASTMHFTGQGPLPTQSPKKWFAKHI